MNKTMTGFLACFLLCLLFLTGTGYAQSTNTSGSYTQFIQSTILSVYSDGSAEVNQTIVPTQNTTLVSIPLLVAQVGNILAVNKTGSPVSYEITGRNITLYTLGTTRVSLVYDTNALTSKQGSVWTVSFDSPSNMTLILPSRSTILSLSSAPLSVSTVKGSPTLALRPGSWEVSYGLPISIGSPSSNSAARSASTTASSQSTKSTSPATAIISIQPSLLLIILALAVVAVMGVFVARRRSKEDAAGQTLRDDDKEILRFMKEKGGRVIEGEIRQRFTLPRTSAWRQAKRLERLGYVRITKVGSQNQVELLRDDFEQK